MGLFTKKPKYDTEHREYVSRLIQEELAIFQKEVDDRYSYKNISSGYRDVDCLMEAYSPKKNDAMLVRYELAYAPDNNIYTAFTMYIRAHFIDLFLHPEDINKSGYEKLNTCSLRPIRSGREKENIAAWGLEDTEAVKFIREGFDRIAAKIDNHILSQFGTVAYSNLPRHDLKTKFYYDQAGKPEQYKEFFANVAKVYPTSASSAKHLALQYGLTLTDEDIRNAKGIDYLLKY